MNTKTYQLKAKEIKRNWHLLDAKDQVLGRMATKIATLLMGKQKKEYTPHMDMGDFVVVINAKKVDLTGNKKEKKLYRRHSGYPGGLKELNFAHLIEKQPEKVIKLAVSGMLPGNRLKDKRLSRLKVFSGEKHDYEKMFSSSKN